jgi:hypothetical protein
VTTWAVTGRAGFGALTLGDVAFALYGIAATESASRALTAGTVPRMTEADNARPASEGPIRFGALHRLPVCS